MAMTMDPRMANRLMNAYAGDSQGLAAAAKLHPDLVKAIALQQLKDQEAAVQRQMAMNQRQQQSVTMQRENELLQRTQQQVAQASTAAAQQQAMQQQRAMQQMATRAAPRASGIGNLPMGAMSMAEGGIVAFEEGGDVTFEKLAKDIDKALMLGASQEDLASLVMRAGYDPAEFGLDVPMTGGDARPAPEAVMEAPAPEAVMEAPAPRQAPSPASDVDFYQRAMDTDPVLNALGFDLPEADFYSKGMDTDPLLEALGARNVSARTGLMGDRPSGTAPVGKGMMGRSSAAARTVKAEDTDDGPTFRFNMPDANFYGGAMDTDPYLAEREELQARPVSGLMAGPAGRPAGREAPRGPGLQGPRSSGTAPVGKGMIGRSVEAAKAAEAARAQPDTPPGAQDVADINLSPEETDLFAALGLPEEALRGRDEDVAAALGLGAGVTADDIIGGSLAATPAGGPPELEAPPFEVAEGMEARRSAAEELVTKGTEFDFDEAYGEAQDRLLGTKDDGTNRFTEARKRAEEIKQAATPDPKAQGWDDFIEKLSSAAGASTAGIGLGRVGMKTAEISRRNKAAEVKRLKDFDDAISKIEAAELGIDKSAMERAGQLQTIAADQIVAGNELLATLTTAEQDRLDRKARAELDIQLSDRDSYWSGVDARLKAEQNKLLENRNNFTAMQEILEYTTSLIESAPRAAKEALADNDPEYQRAVLILQTNQDPTDPKVQEALKTINEKTVAAELDVLAKLRKLGVQNLQRQAREAQSKMVTSLASGT